MHPSPSTQARRSPARPAAVDDGASTRLIGIAAIALLTLLAYSPVFHAGFVWDDDAHVTAASLRSLEGLWRIWFDLGATQQYYPLLHSAFWIEQILWGDAALGYHLVNVVLHIVAAVLLARNLQVLNIPGAWLAAALFALHPVQVESVAWISEQKNTLSAVFYLSSMLVFWRFHGSRRAVHYAAATALFLCALGTKTVTATLPAALLVLLWWRKGRLSWREDVAPLLPWLVLGLAAGLFTAWVERTYIGAAGVEFALSPLERTLLACRALVFYLGKLLWPANLIFIYPRWDVSASVVPWTLYAGAVIAVTVWLWRFSRSNRGPLAAWLFFAGTLFPALGFFNVYPFIYSYVADHFQYLATIGFFALAAALVTVGVRRNETLRKAAIGGVFLILTALAVLTWRQAQTFRDEHTFYTTIIARNPASWLAHYNLANAQRDAGETDSAIAHYKQALALNPRMSDAHNNMGSVLRTAGRYEDALQHFRQAVSIDPRNYRAHSLLGAELARTGDTAGALSHQEEACRLNPSHPESHYYLGRTLQGMGRTDDAIQKYQTALQLDSKFAPAHTALGNTMRQLNRLDEARAHYEAALKLQPNLAGAHNNLGTVLLATGRAAEAIAEFEAALRINPQSREAQQNLAIAKQVMSRGP